MTTENLKCPRCGCTSILKRDYGRTAGSVIGGGAGAAAALSGAEIGGSIGLIAGPLGGIGDAILGA
ncbi:hypothetical protein [Achromobacter denitrificans]|uniref:hypothetical protein n=1 Tax=Achromobacter denitrificans TaxID=32002 RepID=UPI0020CC7B01|nr:hypothetical protein [Achromobacter denitrificans]